jgi:ubiquinone/menaquinone biosynthesis C-methylase UbiE
MSPANAETNEIQSRVAQHYARSDLEQAILDALVASGKDPARLAPADLAPVDEFHTGGRQATVEFAAELDPRPGMHLLDIGCGIGGPSRFFAAERGCRVTGIDLTEDYVAIARMLAERVGLADRVTYRQASALELPFAAETFDGGYMMHVGMNIADKGALFSEVRRVLKAGGSFGIFDVMLTGPGQLAFPVHWSAQPETSFVASPQDYRAALEAAGFAIEKQRDRGDFARAFFREVAARTAAAGAPPPLGIHILMKTDVPQKLANVMQGIESGTIAPVELVCRIR